MYKKFYKTFFLLVVIGFDICFGADGNEWKIGGKIHFIGHRMEVELLKSY